MKYENIDHAETVVHPYALATYPSVSAPGEIKSSETLAKLRHIILCGKKKTVTTLYRLRSKNMSRRMIPLTAAAPRKKNLLSKDNRHYISVY
jgi:hypothetical protein